MSNITFKLPRRSTGLFKVVMGLWGDWLKKNGNRVNSLGNILRDFIKFSICAFSLMTTKFIQLFFQIFFSHFSFNLFSNPFSIFTLCIILLFSFSQHFYFNFLCWLFSFFAHFPHPFHLFNSTPLSHSTLTDFSFNCL
ncbi:hypothetical protein ACOSQ4_021464 [Xanthoceras sorbifolium]